MYPPQTSIFLQSFRINLGRRPSRCKIHFDIFFICLPTDRVKSTERFAPLFCGQVDGSQCRYRFIYGTFTLPCCGVLLISSPVTKLGLGLIPILGWGALCCLLLVLIAFSNSRGLELSLWIVGKPLWSRSEPNHLVQNWFFFPGPPDRILIWSL